MDKYEYKLKLEQIQNLFAAGDYLTAAEMADTINWKKVRSSTTLCMVGEIYEKTGKYGYVGEDGTWVIAPTFDFARDFKDGYAVVSKKVTLANGKEDVQWGTVCHPI